MLALLPSFEAPDFVAATWTVPPGTLGYLKYHPLVDRLRDLAFSSTAYVDPYEPLPEDAQLPCPTIGDEYPAFIPVASLNQLRRYFTFLIRAERFCDGSIASEFENGDIVAALRRIRDLTRQ